MIGTRDLFLGTMLGALAACPLYGQAFLLSSVQAPYPAVQNQVTIAGTTWGSGSVAYGSAGTPLVLTGSGLGSSGTVQFIGYKKGAPDAGYTVQTNAISWSPTSVSVTVPSGSTSGLIKLTSEGKTSNGLPFIVTPGSYSGTCPVSPPSSELQITTAGLDDAAVSEAYSATMQATGGTQGYSWSNPDNSLPSGLSLSSSGVISGTPSQAGTVNVAVQATDSSSPAQTTRAVLSLTVTASTSPSVVYTYSIPSSGGYDGAGNLLTYTDSVMGVWSMSGGYDTLNRLTAATAISGVYQGLHANWSEDAFGNRTSENFSGTLTSPNAPPIPGSSSTSFNANNQVQSAGSAYPPQYDPSGNVTCDSYNSSASQCYGNQYLYDGEGRICAVRNAMGKMVEYLYDAEGTRVAKGTITSLSCNTASNGFTLTTSYILTPGNRQLTELIWSGGTAQWAHTNVWAAGQLIATYSADPDPTQNIQGILNFYFTDWLGSRRVTTDYAGNVEETCHSLPFGNGEDCGTSPTEHLFTGKERDAESGNDYFGARYYGSSMGRFLSPDPAGVAFSDVSNPQSWNLYSYVLNNPLRFTDPDGRECAWEDGSFDSKDDPQTGSYSGCSAAGGIYYDPSTFNLGNGQDWSSSPNATIAGQVADGEALQASLPQGPDPSSATGSSTSTNGTTTTIDLFGTNWQSTQVSTGTHPWRDNNPGDITAGHFTAGNGQIGTDGRFAVFPAAGTGRQALDTLLNGPGYDNLSINAAVSKYAPSFENNTAGYQQFLINALGVSGNTPLSSLSSSQMQTLENAISSQEGFNASGNYSVTTTSTITPP